MIRDPLLHRYWITLDPSDLRARHYASGLGVTAYTLADATRLLRSMVFGGAPVPSFLRVVEDIDVSTLDARHVLPNVGDSVRRGVWFPNTGPPPDVRRT